MNYYEDKEPARFELVELYVKILIPVAIIVVGLFTIHHYLRYLWLNV